MAARNSPTCKASEPQQWRFSIPVTAAQFLELTDQPGIQPARYMHRFGWVSIVHVEQMPGDYLQHLIQASYQRALSSLSQKQQRLISGTE